MGSATWKATGLWTKERLQGLESSRKSCQRKDLNLILTNRWNLSIKNLRSHGGYNTNKILVVFEDK